MVRAAGERRCTFVSPVRFRRRGCLPAGLLLAEKEEAILGRRTPVTQAGNDGNADGDDAKAGHGRLEPRSLVGADMNQQLTDMHSAPDRFGKATADE